MPVDYILCGGGQSLNQTRHGRLGTTNPTITTGLGTGIDLEIKLPLVYCTTHAHPAKINKFEFGSIAILALLPFPPDLQ
jgi:hypothetical protein